MGRFSQTIFTFRTRLDTNVITRSILYEKMIKFCFLFSVTGLCVGIGFGISSKVYEDVKSVAKEPCKFNQIFNIDHMCLQLFVYFTSDDVLFAD